MQESACYQGLNDAQRDECAGILANFQKQQPKDCLWVEISGRVARILCRGQSQHGYATVYQWNLY